MYIEQEILKSIVYIGIRRPEKSEEWGGTGFLVGVPHTEKTAYHYVVTAKHNLEAIYKHKGAKAIIRVNGKISPSYTVEVNLEDWIHHPDPGVDISSCPVGFGPDIDTTAFPLEICRTVSHADWVKVGMDVVFPGLFVSAPGEDRNIPIVRRGSLCQFPEIEIFTSTLGKTLALLIEARSIGGLSGSPVFAYRQSPNPKLGEYGINWQLALIGMIHGHYSAKNSTYSQETLNSGIGIVIPTSKILETIYQPQSENKRSQSSS